MDRSGAPLDASSFPGVLIGAKKGEAWAAEALFRDLQPRLLRFLRATEPRAADDLAGEVWLAMAKGITTFDGDLAGFRAWVFSIARHRLADLRRTAARRATDSVDPADPAITGADDRASTDMAQRVTDQLAAQDAVDLIHASLPADQADVVLLRVLGDLDVAHVAEVMHRSSNWVRVTQFRALRRLAEHFPPDSIGSVMHAHHETI